MLSASNFVLVSVESGEQQGSPSLRCPGSFDLSLSLAFIGVFLSVLRDGEQGCPGSELLPPARTLSALRPWPLTSSCHHCVRFSHFH